ncbi:ribosome-associated ATPase/putative transporter RbbA [Thalassobaculum sp.]|uniref:ribosome-associated ATPase/putative transporter RbbA n=1 Tax=Thalassobaculum sp. TaxID=2022740 RepID=UPI0032EE3CFA
MTAPAARLRGVGHRYGSVAALRDVDLELPAGGTVGVIGPDGVGKSTLLGLVAGARRIQHGSVEVLGGDMADPRHRRAACPRIAYMPQGLGRNLYADLSVHENLAFFGRLFGLARAEREARIADLLAATGLDPYPDRRAGHLSGGMRQKLGLCCALIHDPDLLILDEPTTGVDPLSRRQFWELIDRMRAARPGMTVLASTAYMEEAARFESLVAMHDGAVLAAGTPAALLARTGTRDLEAAFVALLPADRRGEATPLEIAPRPQEHATPVIVARGLTRRFGDFTAVDHVGFEIERGEIFGFLGSNGCGKTTTMKMLTGLLPATEGEATILGSPVDAGGLETRRRVGYMSQSFSLYGELTVAQNLDLHARLFGLDHDRRQARVTAVTADFDLADVLDALPDGLPLGVRQRLSLAVAVIHEPEILILDEPTSGVDPLARDRFWRLLAALSRDRGVTIFVSTHFMNEAARCDRIALMHEGRVLACDGPEAIRRASGAETLEDAFVDLLRRAAPEHAPPAPAVRTVLRPGPAAVTTDHAGAWRRLYAYSLRETLEVMRDPVRLAFSLLGTAFLMLVFGYGISFDVERLRYAVLDGDRSAESRTLLEGFRGSRYFEEQAALADHAEMDRRLRRGDIALAVEIPPGFGRDLQRGRAPGLAVWIDGSMPFRAETIRGYVQGLQLSYLDELARRGSGAGPPAAAAGVEARFRYNQDFRSINAMAPANLALLLVFIPAILTAVGVVREKEMGSITNLYVTPVTRLEFLLGKQIPYVGVAMVNFLVMVAIATLVFGVPVRGSFAALVAGALIYVLATTGIGLLMSTFTRTQVAALFGTAILTAVPTVQFSGLMQPVSSLAGAGQAIGTVFPATYFMKISVGTFTKALGFADLAPQFLALACFFPVLLAASALLLPAQER